MNSSRPRYTSSLGVDQSTNTLIGRVPAGSQNIGVGHSMGGYFIKEYR